MATELTITNPPVYNAVPQDEGNPTEAPPSYFDIIGQLKTVRENSSGPADTAKSALNVICGSVFFTCCMLIYSILPVAQIIIGASNQDSCTIQPKIPLWLIVSGASGVVYTFIKTLTSIVDFVKKRKDPTKINKSGALLGCIGSLLGFFIFVWFILGNYWVYSVDSSVQYDTLVDPANYCDKLVYLFAFWSITATWIMMGLSCLCCCGVLCFAIGCAALVGSKS